jgi:hypothetical protein
MKGMSYIVRNMYPNARTAMEMLNEAYVRMYGTGD